MSLRFWAGCTCTEKSKISAFILKRKSCKLAFKILFSHISTSSLLSWKASGSRMVVYLEYDRRPRQQHQSASKIFCSNASHRSQLSCLVSPNQFNYLLRLWPVRMKTDTKYLKFIMFDLFLREMLLWNVWRIKYYAMLEVIFLWRRCKTSRLIFVLVSLPAKLKLPDYETVGAIIAMIIEQYESMAEILFWNVLSSLSQRLFTVNLTLYVRGRDRLWRKHCFKIFAKSLVGCGNWAQSLLKQNYVTLLWKLFALARTKHIVKTWSILDSIGY